MSEAVVNIEFTDLYYEMLAHQVEHGSTFARYTNQPSRLCISCVREGRCCGGEQVFDLRRLYGWAVPSDAALAKIAECSPGGVVDIGAGGGYWAMLLQQRGVDVIAYDPEPPPCVSSWHAGKAWTAVHRGDHRMAAEHPNRTLLLCWPSYDEPWAAEAVDCYQGDTVVYVGEGAGGCTGDDRLHELFGEGLDDDASTSALFHRVDDVAVPQWEGLHDRLTVYRRRSP